MLNTLEQTELSSVHELVGHAKALTHHLYAFDQDFSSVILKLGQNLKNNEKLRSNLKKCGWSDELINVLVKTTSNRPEDFDYDHINELLSML